MSAMLAFDMHCNSTMLGTRESVPVAAERRQWKRLTVAIPMFVRGMDHHGKPFIDFATVVNISAGGALLIWKRGLRVGEEVSLEIPIASLPQELLPRVVRQFQAQLQRVDRSEACFLVGVRFVNPLPA